MSLTLGNYDRSDRPADVAAFLRPLHEGSMPAQRFRGERDGEWVPPTDAGAGGAVRALQISLRRAGFLPQGATPGVLDYHTFSAARLFQEYVRAVEGLADIGAPDGVVGPKTQTHLARWNAIGKQADWAGVSAEHGTLAFRYWIRVLNLYHALNVQSPINRVVQMTNVFSTHCDTLKLASWRLDPASTHLIGIRRQEWRRAPVRQNDDVFILLIRGLAFGFYGSTDPNPKEAKRPDEPYLVRGQHQYRFGWHKLGDPNRVYRAFRPVGPGVLVCRDSLDDDAFTDADLQNGLKVAPDINIHWGGAGTSNWSAGCQVIAGARYINHLGTRVDCSSFAAASYTALPGKTRAAYNVLLDLITAFAPSSSVAGPSVYYTLIYERDLDTPVTAAQSLSAAARADLPDLNPEAVSVSRLVTALVGG